MSEKKPGIERGYIKLYRKIQDTKIWREKRVFSKAEAWIDILMEVQWNPEPQEVILGMTVLKCNRGESLKSTRTWAKRWNWPQARVVRYLHLLQECNMIRLTNESVTTRLTVINYALYADYGTTNESQMNHKRITNESQMNQDKNVKNERMEEKRHMSGAAALPGSSLTAAQSYAMRFTQDGRKMMDEAHEIIAYLNEAAGKNLPDNYFGTKFIIDRLAEGKTPDQFREIIDKKLKDPKFNRNWMRPETLFTQENFDKYLYESEELYESNDRLSGGAQKARLHTGERKAFPVDVEFG